MKLSVSSELLYLLHPGKPHMAKKVLFVEQRDDGKYKLTEKGSAKPIAVTDTQREAIDKAQRVAPDATLHVERVRDIGPGRDKWRKI